MEKEEDVPLSGKQHYLSLSLGLSSPSGEYGDQSFENYQLGLAGLAKTGYHIEACYAHQMFASLSLLTKFSHNGHGFNARSMIDYYSQVDPRANYIVTSSRYYTSALLAGLQLNLPLENGFLDVSILFGYGSSLTPDLFVERMDGGNYSYVHQEVARASSLVQNYGIGLRWAFSDKFGVKFNVDYYFTRPLFTFHYDFNTGSPQSVVSDQSISMLNSSLGIYYRIRRF